jgi:hypothetical protein
MLRTLENMLGKLRYLVVETGSWFNRRRVLVAPAAVAKIKGICVNLTREHADRPVSRQQETLMNNHYGWRAYWAPDGFLAMAEPVDREFADTAPDEGDPHLRSFRELSSYGVEFDGRIVARSPDFVIDDSTWSTKSIAIVLGPRADARPVALPVAVLGGSAQCAPQAK